MPVLQHSFQNATHATKDADPYIILVFQLEMKEKRFFNKDQYSQREPYNSPRAASFFFDSKLVLLF